MIFALVGNQNSGKTTLFNALTGANQHVGNFPGVTVDQTLGEIKGRKNSTVVDLPGIYSIRPYSSEEKVTRDFIFNNKPDGIINIVDATNIERNLYLSLQLLEMKIPMVIALNMMDEVRANGGTVNIEAIKRELGVPVIPISASKNEGVADLIDEAHRVVNEKILPTVTDFCRRGAVHRCIHAVTHLIEDHAEKLNIAPRFCATKIIENDSEFIEKLRLNRNELDMIEHSVVEMETESGLDRNAALADMRYTFIEDVCRKTIVKCKESKEHKRSVKIDRILTGKYTAIPCFVAIMCLIFYLTFGLIGSFLSDRMEDGISFLASLTAKGFDAYGINPAVRSLIIDGVFSGVGAVLSFLPMIVVLFFFLSVLEDTGYMARVAFVMDKIFRKLGLSGKSFVPMLIGFGCSVPAVMASRTLSSERDRKMTVFLIPFMSCSAKIPIYTFFSAVFFKKYAVLVMVILYFGGMLTGVLSALVMKAFFFKGNPVPFVMELPNYRLPSAKSVLLLLWEKAKDFLTKAFTVIFLATVVIWFLNHFDMHLNYTEDANTGILALIGKWISPLFYPLGFGDWRSVSALISGFTAKEAVVSTLEVLFPSGVQNFFTPLSAASFLTFVLLYTPCAATVTTVRHELKSVKSSLILVLFQCTLAYVAALLVYTLGGLL